MEHYVERTLFNELVEVAKKLKECLAILDARAKKRTKR